MIENFGWRPALAHDLAPFAAHGFLPGRVIAQQRGVYLLITEAGELSAQMAGRLQHQAAEGDYPAVGDWVAFAPHPSARTGTIHAVLPRRSAFTRKAAGGRGTQLVAANVDAAFLVTSMNAEFNPRRLERYLATAWAGGARPVVVLTKADLGGDAVAAAQAVAIGVPVFAVSAVTGAGMDTLAAQLRPGETVVLVGSSGAGKSTLVNALAGREVMATGAIREGDAKGRHTTTHRELFLLPSGALVLDTPGMRELGLFEAEGGLANTFEDIAALAATCRFKNCAHGNEPGCAVRGAVDPARLKNFEKLQRELARDARKHDRLAREAEHKRWIMRSKQSRALRKMKEEF